MLRRLDPGEFVQGTIFTCGLSDSYPDTPALGMLITARCDTAQNKAEVYNYIPIVPVEAWIEKDGTELIAKRSLANELGAMRRALGDAGLAPSIVDLIAHETILAELQAGTSKQQKGIAARFEQAMHAAKTARALLAQTIRSRQEAFTFIEGNDGLYKSLVKELLTNSLSDFHYIEQSDIGEETKGYVALMREIRFISSALGKRIAIGIDADEFEAQSDLFSPGLNHIRFSADHDFAMPLSCISSPNIEFIMQRFANLFSRIGVADISKEKIIEAHSWVKIMRDSAQ